MFRPKSGQTSLFETHRSLPKFKREMLEASWAHVYRTEILRVIPEEKFAYLYSDGVGRPNVPVKVLVSLSLFKELDDLTDEETLNRYYFDTRYQYALQVDPAEAYLAARTLYYFRNHLVEAGAATTALFDQTVDFIIARLGLHLGGQRKDSTHVRSNMAVLSRVGLFVRTITVFLKRLRKTHADRLSLLPAELVARYLDREGYFADVKSSGSRRRLATCARDLVRLVDEFEKDEAVSRMHKYKLAKRLMDEQCVVERETPDDAPRVTVTETKAADPTESVEEAKAADPPESVEEANDADPRVTVKEAKKVASDSLQNPSDPDATYTGKGKKKGYKAQITETCDKRNSVQVITEITVQGAHESDVPTVVPTLGNLEEKGRKPEKFFGDASYNTADNIIEAQALGVELTGPLTTGGSPDPTKLSLADFEIDEASERVVRCPAGERPTDCKRGKNVERMNAYFDKERCLKCGLRERCPVIMQKKRAKLTYTRKDKVIADRRREQETAEFKEEYKIRSGIEATVSELKRKHGLGRLWTRRRERVEFAVVIKATACNLKRFMKHVAASARKRLKLKGKSASAPIKALISAISSVISVLHYHDTPKNSLRTVKRVISRKTAVFKIRLFAV